jgi:hypothetical protein
VAPPLELTDIVYTSGFRIEGRTDDRARARQDRRATPGDHRHAQEVSGSVALTCRYYGISRPTYNTWFWHYEETRQRRDLTPIEATPHEPERDDR